MSYGTEEFDDYLQFANSDTSQLWTRDTGTNDILSKTSGNVRIGQDRIYPVKNPAGFIPVDDQPAAKIEVMGHVSANVLQAPRLCPMEVQGEDTLCDDREIENGIIPQNFFTSALMTQPFDPYADGGKAGQGIHCQSSKTGDDKWATKGFTSLGKVDEKCDYDKIEDLSGTKCKTDEWAYGYDPVKKTFLCTNKSLYGKLEANNLDQYTCADCTNNGGGPGGSGGAGTGGAGTGGAGTGGAGAGGPKK
ncbi:MAG: hypothetical protein L6Q57_00365 [Alphaproteobacteria bacterium]|nr:hypothetical protein [Alphaproteobacteria bacterium]